MENRFPTYNSKAEYEAAKDSLPIPYVAAYPSTTDGKTVVVYANVDGTKQSEVIATAQLTNLINAISEELDGFESETNTKLTELVSKAIISEYSNPSLRCISGSVTNLLPLVVNNGDYLICKVNGNTGVKAISLCTETEIVDEDIIKLENGNNGNIIVKAKNDSTHFKVFSNIEEYINITFFVVNDKIERENIIDVFGKEYGSYIMTTFYNDTQRLRVLVSSNGKHFTEIVTNKDINNSELLRDQT